jgi:hypothetical protein
VTIGTMEEMKKAAEVFRQALSAPPTSASAASPLRRDFVPSDVAWMRQRRYEGLEC